MVFLLIASAFRWQVILASDLKRVAEGRISSSELQSLRGSIYASDGTTLAYSEPRFDMYIWLKDLQFFEENKLQTRQEFLQKVAPIIDTTPDELGKTLSQNEQTGVFWFKVASSIDADKWRQLAKLTAENSSRLLRGFAFVYTSERVYPEERLASHIVGLTNKYKDKVYGAGGIEEQWDGDLNPTEGLRVEETDAIGQAVASALFLTVEPHPGSSVYTTIDKKLQTIIEERVEASVKEYGAQSGSIIVMDPKTGAIMGMANYPDYNPNLREEVDLGVYTNRAISIPYEMGSVGKVLTLAAVLDQKILTPDSVVLPEGHPGCVFLADELGDLCTWDKKPQPAMNITRCFILSDNVCFYEISKHMEEKAFYDYLIKFGIGQKTGIEIAGESNGYIRDASEWTLGDIAAYSYGHGYSVNALQALSAVSVIPNNGVRIQPRIVDKVVKGDGEVIQFKPIAMNNGQYVIQPETAELVAGIMHQAYLSDIRDWEWWFADLKNYYIGMKSGTALIANQFGYTSDVNTTQVGFDLSPERKFAMLVKLEKPTVGGQLSYYNSRIMWLETFAAIKDYLHVPRK